MAKIKISETNPLASPYAHELNTSGDACSPACPACRWLQRTSDGPWHESHAKGISDFLIHLGLVSNFSQN